MRWLAVAVAVAVAVGLTLSVGAPRRWCEECTPMTEAHPANGVGGWGGARVIQWRGGDLEAVVYVTLGALPRAETFELALDGDGERRTLNRSCSFSGTNNCGGTLPADFHRFASLVVTVGDEVVLTVPTAQLTPRIVDP